jgi:hypothetical protein
MKEVPPREFLDFNVLSAAYPAANLLGWNGDILSALYNLYNPSTMRYTETNKTKV